MNPVAYTDGLSRREIEPTTPWGRWIRDVYKGAHLTQDEFADKLGVHRQTVTSWKKGEYEPKRNNVEQIMRKFPGAPRPPAERAPEAATENHTPAQIPQARAGEAPALTTRHANVGMLMAAIEKWAAGLGIANPIDDSEFAHALSSAWLEHGKRLKPAKPLR